VWFNRVSYSKHKETVISSETGSIQVSNNRIFAMVLLSNPGGVAGVVLPTLVNAFVASGISIGVATRLIATELMACALVTLIAPLLINIVNRRYLAFTAILLSAAGQLLSLEVKTTALIFACRAGAGLGAGLLYALAVASLSATAKPTRSLAIMLASNLISATVIMALISWLARTTPTAAILVMGIFVILQLPFVPALPAHVRVASNQPRTTSSIGNWRLVILGLVGMFFFAMTFGAIWPMIGQIGAKQGIDHRMIALGFSVAGFGGIAGAIVSAALSNKLARRTALLLGATCYAICILLALSPAFVAAMILMMFCFTFTIPHYISLLTAIDTTGRLSVLTSAMIPFGIAAGQTFAGILASYAFSFVVYGGEATLLSSLAVIMLATTFMRRENESPGNLNALA
jgi:predicted MFS family arabinose efflux permease